MSICIGITISDLVKVRVRHPETVTEAAAGASAARRVRRPARPPPGASAARRARSPLTGESGRLKWRQALNLPSVQGLVVGRSLLHPARGNVETAVDTAVVLL